jgi:hypothetical protein
MSRDETGRYSYASRTVKADNWQGRHREVSVPAPVGLYQLPDDDAWLRVELTFVMTVPKGTIGSAWPGQEFHEYVGMITWKGKHLMSPWRTGVGIPVHGDDLPQQFLHALFQDATTQSFPSWMDDFGGDTDSIEMRNAYEACVQIGRQLHQLLGSTVFGQVEDLIEGWDY